MAEDQRSEPYLPAPQEPTPYPVASREVYPLEPWAGASEPEALDIRRILEGLWRRKIWIFAGAVLGLAGGIIATRFIEPEFSVRSTVWLQRESEGTGPIRGDDPFGGAGWNRLLRSTDAVLIPIVREMQLFLEPIELDGAEASVFSGFSVTDTLLGGTYELTTDPGSFYRLTHVESGWEETGRLGEPIGGSVGFEWAPSRAEFAPESRLEFELTSLRSAAGGLGGGLESSFDENASILTATLKWDDRHEAPIILNTLVDRFIETATDLKNRQLSETVNILREQERVAAERLRTAELSLENFRVQTATLPTEQQALPIPGMQGTQDPVFGGYFGLRTEQRMIQDDVGHLRAILRDAGTTGEIDALALQLVPSVQRSVDLTSALAELSALEAQRRALLNVYTERVDTVQVVVSQIANLQNRTIPGLVQRLIEELETYGDRLEGQLSAQATELRQMPVRTIEQARLERELGAAARLHGDIQARLKQAELALDTSLPDMQVLDRAATPSSPLNDEAARILLMATMAGLGLGIAGALIHDRLDKRIRHPSQVTHSLGLPVLGMVPQLDGAHDVDAEEAIEAFRAIRTQISHAQGSSRGILLVTSPAPRDGKSMVAANLAISYASSGLRTILVDADMRRGRAQQMFGLERVPGLTDVLGGDVPLDGAIQPTSVERLDLLARGAGQSFRPELLDGTVMEDVLLALRSEYEVVILDAPPLVAGADALVLGKLSDRVVLVLRAGETDEVLARTKLDLIGYVDVPIVGAVLNAVSRKAHYYGYYRYSYDVETVS